MFKFEKVDISFSFCCMSFLFWFCKNLSMHDVSSSWYFLFSMNTSFWEVLLKAGFYSSLNLTSYTLHLVFMSIMNSVPTPSSLLTSTLPPIYSIICLQMDKPRPVPYKFLFEFSSNLLKLINSFLSPSLEMPTPVSMMLILISRYLSYPCLIF